MKQVETYCDCCARKMSYTDSAGEVCTNGVTVVNDITMDMEARTGSGSKSSRVELRAADYCSTDCAIANLQGLIVRLQEHKVEPLPKE